MSQPFFSVIVPTYNRAAFLERCITSVVKQTFTDWELLIIDDGSTDHTKALATSYVQADPRIQYFYQTNQKVSAARNLGLEKASGKYLCFLDSDDGYEPHHLQFFYNYLEKENFPEVFLSTAFKFKDDHSEQTIQAPVISEYKDPRLTKIMSAYLPYSPCVQTICIPASIRGKVKFDTRLFPSECYDFCARVASLLDGVVYFPETTVTLYGHGGNASVPLTPSELIRFNTRQYQEFKIMSKESFYKEIIKTKAFRWRMFYLQMDIAKSLMKQKKIGKFVSSFFKALRYNPTYLFKFSYLKILK